MLLMNIINNTLKVFSNINKLCFFKNWQKSHKKRRGFNPTRTDPQKMRGINLVRLSVPQDESYFNDCM